VAKQNFMIENFSFTLKNNKAKLLKRVTWICFIGLIILLITSIINNAKTNESNLWNKIKLIGAVIICIIYYFLRKEKEILQGFQYVIFGMLIAGFETFFGIYLSLILTLFLLFITWFTYQKTIINFSSEIILLKTGFVKRQVEWDALSNVVLKDNILTLDFKNDKLIQEEVEGEVVNEESFMAFIKQKQNL
jgi:hypothetical protein